MGEVIKVEFKKPEIAFVEGEFRLDDRDDKLVIYIPVELAARRVRDSRPQPAKPAAAVEIDIDGVNWEGFFRLNIQLVRSGKRSESVVASMKHEMGMLKAKYGVYALNAGIARLRIPQQAQIPYLKKVMKNMKGVADVGKQVEYESEIANAVANLPGMRQGS